MAALTPLSFATEYADSFTINSNTVYNIPIDNSFKYVSSYFYGANSSIIDCKRSDGWYRIIINNTCMGAFIRKNNNTFQLGISSTNSNSLSNYIYYYQIGAIYSTNSSFRSDQWFYMELDHDYTQLFNLVSPVYINCANCPITVDTDTVNYQDVTHCDFNAYYPFTNGSSSSSGASVDLSPVLNNQSTIINKENEILTKMSQNQMDNWRYFTALSKEFKTYSSANQSMAQSIANSQEDKANSRQSQIMDAGSDVTVSTIDNWVGGQNGLAGKLTELAATLSSNADIFSQNQSQNQANLSKAGEFVGNVFNQIPTGITAAAVCFLIILIAVKVVGR